MRLTVQKFEAAKKKAAVDERRAIASANAAAAEEIITKMEVEIASTSKLHCVQKSGFGHTQKAQRTTVGGATRVSKIFLVYHSPKRKQGSNSKRVQQSSPMDTSCKSPDETDKVDLLTLVEAKETIVMDKMHSVAKELFNQVDDEDVVIVKKCDAEGTAGEEESWKEVVCRKAGVKTKTIPGNESGNMVGVNRRRDPRLSTQS